VNPHERLYLLHGDITELAADAVACPTSTDLDPDPTAYGFKAFAARFDRQGFVAGYREQAACLRSCHVGEIFWVELESAGGAAGSRRQRAVLVVASARGRHGRPRPGHDEARTVVRQTLSGAAAHLSALPDYRDLPRALFIALPTFRHGESVDRLQMLRSARAEMEKALSFLGGD
jgi:hypothetical protein